MGAPPSRGRRILRWAVRLALLGLVLGILAAVAFVVLIQELSQDLPEVFAYETYLAQAKQASRVLASDGTIISEFFEERRTVVPKERVPRVMQLAMVAAEDADFYRHGGVDYMGIARAMWRNLRAGRFVQGASTITQQVARTFYLTQEKTISRKLREMVLARELERRMSKEEILTLYLNQIYFGHGAYGIEEASRTFFGRSVDELGLAEAALLAGLVQSPERLSPYKHPERARKRRAYVLEQMMEKGFVDRARGEEALASDLGVLDVPPRRARRAPWFADVVRRRLKAVFSEAELKTGGLRVETTVDLGAQQAADRAVQRGVAHADLRLKVWEPERHFKELDAGRAFVDRWARKRGTTLRSGRLVPVLVVQEPIEGLATVYTPAGPGVLRVGLADARLARAAELAAEEDAKKKRPRMVPAHFAPKVGDLYRASPTGKEVEGLAELGPELGVQAALVVIEPTTREVKALVGGADPKGRGFNRAVLMRRQAGSSFKPVVYGTAIEAGLVDEETLFFNTPETYRLPGGKTWTPRNFSGNYDGKALSLADALAGSVNVVAVQVLSRVGVDAVMASARRMGFRGALARNYTLALGSAEVTPLELANSVATLADMGRWTEPIFVRSVHRGDGTAVDFRAALHEKLCAEANPPCPEPGPVFREATVRTLWRLMREVVLRGTARSVRKLGRLAMGKTGTSNKGRNLWFAGFTPELAAAAFVGYDDRRPIHRGSGGKYAAPIWLDFMQHELEGRAPSIEPEWMQPRPPTAADLMAPEGPPPGGVEVPSDLGSTQRIAPPPDLERTGLAPLTPGGRAPTVPAPKGREAP